MLIHQRREQDRALQAGKGKERER
eukprot:SAG31_NODE_30833_length_375_cov_1.152174_1_plen_23_part_01